MCATASGFAQASSEKHGDYGMRESFKAEPELTLNASGTCQACAQEPQQS